MYHVSVVFFFGGGWADIWYCTTSCNISLNNKQTHSMKVKPSDWRISKCRLSCHQCLPSSTNFWYSPRTCLVIITWFSASRIHSETSRNINKGYPWTLTEFTTKPCTSLTTSFISKYILTFICCQVWTENAYRWRNLVHSINQGR